MSKRAGESAEIMAFMRDKQPLGAMMSAADVAGMAVFLLGDRARARNGGDRGCRLVRQLARRTRRQLKQQLLGSVLAFAPESFLPRTPMRPARGPLCR